MERNAIVVVGSINMDLVARAERIPVAGETISGSGFAMYPGGKGANQAVAVGRLGWPVKMIGCVGEDAFGAELRASLDRAGVDISGVKTVPGSSGVAAIVVAADGGNCIVAIPGANAKLLPGDLDEHRETIRKAGAVLAQLEIPLETVERLAAICEEEGIPLVLDPAPARALPQSLMRRVTWFTPNESEAIFYKDEPEVEPEKSAEAMLALGARNVILKLGSAGVFLAAADGCRQKIAAVQVDPVDTTAAGDAFNGAFARALVSGDGPDEAARFAVAAAAFSVTRQGAQTSLPTLDEVAAFYKVSDQ